MKSSEEGTSAIPRSPQGTKIILKKSDCSFLFRLTSPCSLELRLARVAPTVDPHPPRHGNMSDSEQPAATSPVAAQPTVGSPSGFLKVRVVVAVRRASSCSDSSIHPRALAGRRRQGGRRPSQLWSRLPRCAALACDATRRRSAESARAPGILSCLDGYMNIALEHTDEYVDGVKKNHYGDAFIRGNNGELLRRRARLGSC